MMALLMKVLLTLLLGLFVVATSDPTPSSGETSGGTRAIAIVILAALIAGIWFWL